MRSPMPWTLALVIGSFTIGGCAGPAQDGMGRTVIEPSGQGSALFSSAVRAGDLVFLSGVIGRDGPDGVQGATRQALEGIRERVEASDATMADVVQCTVYLTDMDDYGAMNEVYSEYWTSDPPARTAVAVQEVPASAILEIACIAAVP